jgi:hypothetical protein
MFRERNSLACQGQERGGGGAPGFSSESFLNNLWLRKLMKIAVWNLGFDHKGLLIALPIAWHPGGG